MEFSSSRRLYLVVSHSPDAGADPGLSLERAMGRGRLLRSEFSNVLRVPFGFRRAKSSRLQAGLGEGRLLRWRDDWQPDPPPDAA